MKVLAIVQRELLGYFLSPLGWLVLTLFLLVQGYGFYLVVELLSQPRAPQGAVLQYFFGGTFIYWLFVIVVTSAITMRLVAEERRSGTIESLLSAPVSEKAVVLGKYLAAVLFYGALWLPTTVYLLLLWRLADQQPIGLGPVASGYLGTMVVGATCLAVGTLASTLTRNQVVAALLSFALLTLLLLVGSMQGFSARPAFKAVFAHLSLFDQMDDFARGIVDSRHLVFHASLVVLCLCVAVKALERRKWA